MCSVNLDVEDPLNSWPQRHLVLPSRPGFAVLHHVQTLHGRRSMQQTYAKVVGMHLFGQTLDMEPINQ